MELLTKGSGGFSLPEGLQAEACQTCFGDNLKQERGFSCFKQGVGLDSSEGPI